MDAQEVLIIDCFPFKVDLTPKAGVLSHHSPGLLVFGLQDARVEDLQEKLQTSRGDELEDRKTHIQSNNNSF